MILYLAIWLLCITAVIILCPSLLREANSSGWRFWPCAAVMFGFLVLAFWSLVKAVTFV